MPRQSCGRQKLLKGENKKIMIFTQEGSGNALLFLHGWGCSGEIWKNQREFFAKNYRVITVDLPGFGNSPPPQKAEDSHYFAEEIYAILKALDIKKVLLVGHSFGGKIALLLTAKHPEIVSALVLVSSTGVLRNRLKNFVKKCLYKTAKLLAKIGLIDKEKLQRGGSADFKASQGVMRGVLCKIVKEDVLKQARLLCCPTLLIWGKDDGETPLKSGKKLEKNIKNSALVLCGKGHFPFLENPFHFNLLLAEFLKEAC